jgi:5-dehydro-4-deoxyglucarate dehydratase
MSRAAFEPEKLRTSIEGGLLAFPLTDFDGDDRFDPQTYADRVSWMGKLGAAALFPAGGAGEFFSLAHDEYDDIVRTAVETGPQIPLIAATGYGTRMAVDFARRAEKVGADGILLLPPYLTEASQDGLFAHIRAVCDAVGVAVIVYNRANCRLVCETLLRLADACPNLIGFKDGVGDLEELSRTKARLGDRFVFINGMPTAEVFAQAYEGMGIATYTSAIYNFAPRSALRFHRAITQRDHEEVASFVRDFLTPYSRIRAAQPGYAVSIVKAGADIVGRSAGRVRPPLSALAPEEHGRLEVLIESLGPQE